MGRSEGRLGDSQKIRREGGGDGGNKERRDGEKRDNGGEERDRISRSLLALSQSLFVRCLGSPPEHSHLGLLECTEY